MHFSAAPSCIEFERKWHKIAGPRHKCFFLDLACGFIHTFDHNRKKVKTYLATILLIERIMG
jgi:hypothetical protein